MYYGYMVRLMRQNQNSGKEVKAVLFALKEKGQGLVEYALIIVLVAIIVIAILFLLGPSIANLFSTVNNSISSAS
jgi:pilus assembly protein Flp/PilA